MGDFIIMERIAGAATGRLCNELPRTEDLGAFEQIVATGIRAVAASCIVNYTPGFFCVMKKVTGTFSDGESTKSQRAVHLAVHDKSAPLARMHE